MVRGNWQRRVERTEARRTAAKLQKEQRRSKRNSSSGVGGDINDYKASYERLEEWLGGRGDGIGVSFDDDGGTAVKDDMVSQITVDIWTDARPENRPEYLPNSLDENGDFHDQNEVDGKNTKGKSKGKKEKQNRGGSKKSKGKSHPNAKNKHEPEDFGRERSNSMAQKNTMKDDRLCGQEFFFGKGKCKGTHQQLKQQRQKGRRARGDSMGGEEDAAGCTFQHYHQLPKVKRTKSGAAQIQPMTLSQVLNEKLYPHHIQHCNQDDSRPTASLPGRVREATLKSSFNALIDNAKEREDCMDMIYHSRYFVENKNKNRTNDADTGEKYDSDKSSQSDIDGDDHEGDSNNKCKNEQATQKSTILSTVEKILDKDKISPTSIVYLTIQGVLVYDRNRGGLVYTENEERFLLFGDPVDDVIEDDLHPDDEDREPIHIHEQLTHHLLDEILSFCGDETAAVLPQVCASWHDEVGKRSPQLWRMLLGRHEWPLSAAGEESSINGDILDECKQRKEAFTSHYKVVRDVRALTNACNKLAGSNNSNNKHSRFESAIQMFKATKGAPIFNDDDKDRCIVKIWSNESGSTRALAAYQDFTLRLFEVDRGSSSSSIAQGSSSTNTKHKIKCRQIVCVRATPPSVSRKKDCCELLSMDLDEEVVACFVVEPDLDVEGLLIPWMTVISRDDIVCSGNEGLLEDECIQAISIRETILDYLLDSPQERELQEGLHNYLATSDGDTSDVSISVTEKLIACGKGHFLFHAYIYIPGQHATFGHRLFLISTRTGTIVQSHHLERNREGTNLFASRPFKRRLQDAPGTVLCTNILVCGPTEAVLSLSVEINRDRTVDIINKLLIENEEFAPWSKMKAALTSLHAVFTTDPVQGPFLHIQSTLPFNNEGSSAAVRKFVSIKLGGRTCTLQNIFIIRDHYVAVVISKSSNDEEEFDGQWFGINETSCEIIIYHVPNHKEIHRSQIPSEQLSMDCIGDTLAMNVSNLGFVITGENARDVARPVLNKDAQAMLSPSGKTPKTKKKRLASLASGRKKDGFARGMSLRG